MSDGNRQLAARLRALARLLAQPGAETPWWRVAGIESVPRTDGDDWAATHYRVLTHDLLPAAGVFLEQRGMLGGVVGRAVQDRMQAAGFDAGGDGLSPDHAAHELAFLAHLLESYQMAGFSDFWRHHASGWMPLLPGAWVSSGEAEFEALAAALKSTFNAIDKVALAAGDDEDQRERTPPALADMRLDLDDPQVGLAQIGTFLAVPARSGLALTRAWMSRAGRRFRLPTGFGSRLQICEGLLRSAAQYDAMNGVCDLLDEALHETSAMWRARMEAVPTWSAHWLERIGQTGSVVARLRAGA